MAFGPSHLSFENVQLFDVIRDSLTLIDIFHLLKILPALKKLCCEIDGLGNWLEHLPKNELPDYVASRYGNVGSNMVELHAGFHSTLSKNSLTEFLMLLALACPNLYKISTWDTQLPDYRAGVTEVLQSNGSFSKYAPQFRQLLK
ncbi:hypothetical protein GGF41_000049 [Coemansia sp. RSA 2531]|nr:hypothetical protein GGF41_000049 [Coemansia sp. RSA 2531]